jgi:hypothetical protein
MHPESAERRALLRRISIADSHSFARWRGMQFGPEGITTSIKWRYWFAARRRAARPQGCDYSHYGICRCTGLTVGDNVATRGGGKGESAWQERQTANNEAATAVHGISRTIARKASGRLLGF